jgi:tetratricopeptide (TPR) repeat protein
MMSLLQSRSSNKTGRRVAIDLQKAERALKDGRHQEVEQVCSEVLEERPDTAQACQLLAELRLKQRRFDEGMSWVQRARDIDPEHPRTLNLLGRVLDHRGDLAEAEAAFRKSVERDPEYADALANLGHVLLRTGRAAEAEQLFRRAIQYDREHGLANLSLGAILYEQRRPELAVLHLQAGIQRELTNRPGQFTLAIALHQLGRFDEAITAYRRLVAAGDEDPRVYSGLAAALDALGDVDIATAGYEVALEIEPGFPPAAAGLADIMTRKGRVPEAFEILAPLADRGDAPACLHVAQARALCATGREDEALLLLADLVKRPGEPDQLAPAHFMLGDLLDSRGEFDRAFAQYRRARKLREGRYQPAAQEDFVDRLSGSFTREAIKSMPHGCATDVPVFIIGMPCAGAVLLENIIAAHPRAASAGALPHIDLGAGRLGRYNNAGLAYPECTVAMRERDLRELSAAFLARLFAGHDRMRRIVDSNWLNFLHVGLIELMFPSARLIHCRRSPLDMGLGCYFRDFHEPGEPFAARLSDIGHFHGQYLRLMDHWREHSSLPMLEVEFEALVNDRKGERQRVMDFLGLPWDPACESAEAPGVLPDGRARPGLRPRETTIGWSQNYEKHLGPLREGFAAAGYPID